MKTYCVIFRTESEMEKGEKYKYLRGNDTIPLNKAGLSPHICHTHTHTHTHTQAHIPSKGMLVTFLCFYLTIKNQNHCSEWDLNVKRLEKRNNSFAKLCSLVPGSLVHLEIPHESRGFETQLLWTKGWTFPNPCCSELVDSHELFILCDLMGERTAHLLGSH